MNEKVVEHGFIISGTTYEELLAASTHPEQAKNTGAILVGPGYFEDSQEYQDMLDDMGLTFDGRDVETHPFDPNYIFVSYDYGTDCDTCDDAPEPTSERPSNFTEIMAAAKEELPKGAKIRWGRIHTER